MLHLDGVGEVELIWLWHPVRDPVTAEPSVEHILELQFFYHEES